MKLCIVYNFAQKYREGIFRLLENYYECLWVFGNNSTDIKPLEHSVFRDVHEVTNKKILGPIYYQTGSAKLLFENDNVLMLGELFCLSTWIVLILRRFFFRKKKVFLWSHGWYGREGCVKKMLKRCFFGMSDASFLYGNYALGIARLQGYKKNNLHVIYNSLNYDEQVSIRERIGKTDIYIEHFGNNKPVLVFIGRLTMVKHLDLLVNAMSIMPGKYNLVFVGDGEMRRELEDMVRKQGLEQYVWFYGACYDELKNAELLSNADLCVSPGNVGLTAIHSMTYGTPVLTHDNYAFQMPEFESIKEGKTGAFYQWGSEVSLMETINQWFKVKSDLREEVRQCCYMEVEKRWNPHVQFEIFKSIIK